MQPSTSVIALPQRRICTAVHSIRRLVCHIAAQQPEWLLATAAGRLDTYERAKTNLNMTFPCIALAFAKASKTEASGAEAMPEASSRSSSVARWRTDAGDCSSCSAACAAPAAQAATC
jgi:uncharacterized damage-inducible protein DinB